MAGVTGLQVEVTELLPAPPDRVFALLTDVERMAGLGPEHTGAVWVGDDRGVGAVFVGTNQLGGRTWEVPCRVTELEPPARFGWEVGDPELPTATWSYDLTPTDGGTRVVHRFVHGPGRSFLRAVVDKHPDRAELLVAGRAQQLAANVRASLRAAAALLAPAS